ncbi:MAG: hypothetical protein PHC75_07985 [Burkholderiales bacterium]|nr:hypothetical protein [Burkholderiales bacterium]
MKPLLWINRFFCNELIIPLKARPLTLVTSLTVDTITVPLSVDNRLMSL